MICIDFVFDLKVQIFGMIASSSRHHIINTLSIDRHLLLLELVCVKTVSMFRNFARVSTQLLLSRSPLKVRHNTQFWFSLVVQSKSIENETMKKQNKKKKKFIWSVRHWFESISIFVKSFATNWLQNYEVQIRSSSNTMNWISVVLSLVRWWAEWWAIEFNLLKMIKPFLNYIYIFRTNFIHLILWYCEWEEKKKKKYL